MFLKSNGFDYILKVFMDKQIASNGQRGEFQSQFELKHVAFLLKLLRIFIMAAFSTTDDSSIFTVVSLVRRQSTQDVRVNTYAVTKNCSSPRFKPRRY